MKKLIPGTAAFIIFCLFSFNYSIAGPANVSDIEEFPFCKYCGMDRNTFAYSRMLITYDDGTVIGMCSLHCAVIDIALNSDMPMANIMVGDYQTKKLIHAETAYWVIGGEKTGVMTKRAKWAFENSQDAEAFLIENGGERAVFDDAVKASFEDMYEDIQMIRQKRHSSRN